MRRWVSRPYPASASNSSDTEEQGQFFPYFITSVLGLVLIPLTYSTLRPSTGLHIPSERYMSMLTRIRTRHIESSADQKS